MKRLNLKQITLLKILLNEGRDMALMILLADRLDCSPRKVGELCTDTENTLDELEEELRLKG